MKKVLANELYPEIDQIAYTIPFQALNKNKSLDVNVLKNTIKTLLKLGKLI